MRRYLILTAIMLPLGFAVGHFNNQYQEKKAAAVRSHMHVYGKWQSSGKTGGLTRSHIIMERKCYLCGSIDTKLSD